MQVLVVLKKNLETYCVKNYHDFAAGHGEDFNKPILVDNWENLSSQGHFIHYKEWRFYQRDWEIYMPKWEREDFL